VFALKLPFINAEAFHAFVSRMVRSRLRAISEFQDSRMPHNVKQEYKIFPGGVNYARVYDIRLLLLLGDLI